jgi:hypothetical protein
LHIGSTSPPKKGYEPNNPNVLIHLAIIVVHDDPPIAILQNFEQDSAFGGFRAQIPEPIDIPKMVPISDSVGHKSCPILSLRLRFRTGVGDHPLVDQLDCPSQDYEDVRRGLPSGEDDLPWRAEDYLALAVEA